MLLDHSALTRERLNAIILHSPPHLTPLWEVTRDYGVSLCIVDQDGKPFPPPPILKPSILLTCDDFDAAYGPTRFHGPSMRAAIRAADFAVVISCAALPRFYIAAAALAIIGGSTVIVETRPEQESQWIGFIQLVKPGLRMLIGTVKGETA